MEQNQNIVVADESATSIAPLPREYPEYKDLSRQFYQLIGKDRALCPPARHRRALVIVVIAWIRRNVGKTAPMWWLMLKAEELIGFHNDPVMHSICVEALMTLKAIYTELGGELVLPGDNADVGADVMDEFINAHKAILKVDLGYYEVLPATWPIMETTPHILASIDAESLKHGEASKRHMQAIEMMQDAAIPPSKIREHLNDLGLYNLSYKHTRQALMDLLSATYNNGDRLVALWDALI